MEKKFLNGKKPDFPHKYLSKVLIINENNCPICMENFVEEIVYIVFNEKMKKSKKIPIMKVESKYCEKCGINFLDKKLFNDINNMNDDKTVTGYNPPRFLLQEYINSFINFIQSNDYGLNYIDFFRCSKQYLKLYSVNLLVDNKKKKYILNNIKESKTEIDVMVENKNELSIYQDELGRAMESAIFNCENSFNYNNKEYEFLEVVNLPENKIIFKTQHPLNKKGNDIKVNTSKRKKKNAQKDKSNVIFKVEIRSSEHGVEKISITNETKEKNLKEKLNQVKKLSYCLHPLAMHIVFSIRNNSKNFICNDVNYEILQYDFVHNKNKSLDAAYQYIVTHGHENAELVHAYNNSLGTSRMNYNKKSKSYDRFHSLNPNSIFSDRGYSVAENGPSPIERRQILISIIKRGEKTKQEVISFLRWNIENKSHQKNACLEWRSDCEYIKRNA